MALELAGHDGICVGWAGDRGPTGLRVSCMELSSPGLFSSRLIVKLKVDRSRQKERTRCRKATIAVCPFAPVTGARVTVSFFIAFQAAMSLSLENPAR